MNADLKLSSNYHFYSILNMKDERNTYNSVAQSILYHPLFFFGQIMSQVNGAVTKIVPHQIIVSVTSKSNVAQQRP